MKFEVFNSFSRKVQFIADIDCEENTSNSIKLGMSVLWAIKHCTNLRGADLRGANLRDVNLRGANLRDANLCYADLRGANLRDVNLRDANLCYADLRDADLCYANLCYANLRNANLRNADLRNADLQKAILDFSAWPLHCGSKNVVADDRLVSQLLFHVVNLDVSQCSGGVQEAVELLRKMGVCNLFPEYRDDVDKRTEFENE